jgi:dCMP deaminase
MLGPRKDFLTWDEVWMGQAVMMSKRSKDPNTQVGAYIVDDENIPISIGYNGFPRNIKNDELPWNKKGKPLDTKYMYVCHAEQNAIDNSDCSRERMTRSRVYTTLFPCNECTKKIIQSGIKEVIYLSDKYHKHDSQVAARKMFKLAGVKTRQLKINKTIVVELKNDG